MSNLTATVNWLDATRATVSLNFTGPDGLETRHPETYTAVRRGDSVDILDGERVDLRRSRLIGEPVRTAGE